MQTTSIDIRREGRAAIVQSNLQKMREHRVQLLNIPQVLSGLNEMEIEIAEAGTRSTIANYDKDKLVEQLGLYCKTLCRDLGIRTWDNPGIMQVDTAAFFTILVKHYKHLTMAEVQQAFDYLLVGKLDDFLPKDKNGDPDKGHYQMFSVEFQTKVLNAYVKLQRKVWSKVNHLKPIESIMNEQTKQDNHRAFIDMIYGYFQKYTELGIMPPINGASIVLAEFERQGIVSGIPKPKEHNFDAAFLKIMQANINPIEKSKVAEQRSSGKISEKLEAEARVDANNECIKMVFDKIIAEKLEIKNVIKYRL